MSEKREPTDEELERDIHRSTVGALRAIRSLEVLLQKKLEKSKIGTKKQGPGAPMATPET